MDWSDISGIHTVISTITKHEVVFIWDYYWAELVLVPWLGIMFLDHRVRCVINYPSGLHLSCDVLFR